MGRLIPVSEPSIFPEDVEMIRETAAKGFLSGRASPVKEFEKAFNEKVCNGHKYTCAVANGTVALQLALESLGLKKGEPVVVPALTYAACVNAILDAGGVPVFADLSPDDSWCAGPKELRETALCSGASKIMAVHLYGEPVPLRTLHLSFRYIIEDCAEALGSYYEPSDWKDDMIPECCGSKPYSVGCYSFFANKLLTMGEGGLVAFPDTGDYALNKDFIKRLYNNGTSSAGDYFPTIPAHNMRIGSLQAALGWSQLQRLDDLIMMRRGVMDLYTLELGGTIRTTNKERCPQPWLFSIYVPEAQGEAAGFLKKEYGVETRLPFPVLPECIPYKKYSGGKEFPIARQRAKEWLFLPSSPMLSCRDQEVVIEGIKSFIKVGG